MVTLPKEYEVIFVKKEKAAADAYSFYFQRPPGLDFLPGQYLRIQIPVLNPDARGDKRLFSIASSPTTKDHLMITTRIIQSTFKKTLFNISPLTKVKITAPFGIFTLNQKETMPHVFLAGGIGMTPFRSMIFYATDNHLQIPITLISSFRTPEDILFKNDFEEITKRNKYFKFIQTITRPEGAKTPWHGLTGRINADLLKANLPDLKAPIYYIAGPPLMVDELAKLLKSLGIEDAKIRAERFSGY